MLPRCARTGSACRWCPQKGAIHDHRMRCGTKPGKGRVAPLSPPSDSNRRPADYKTTALTTELEGRGPPHAPRTELGEQAAHCLLAVLGPVGLVPSTLELARPKGD